MKIKKLMESKIIVEADEVKPAEEVAAELNPTNKDIPNNLDQVSTNDMVADMAAGAVEVNKANNQNIGVNVEAAKKEAEKVKEVSERIFNRNPYKATAKLSEVEEILQSSLETALDEKEVGHDDDYPNVIIYGLAGFGKTAGVKKWCKDHGINAFECDAKNMDAATIGGIPFPEKDKSGKTMSTPVASHYWDGLFEPNTVLILDEFNRARPNVVGSFLTLINNHDLPISEEDPETGKTSTKHHFDNILFTIIMFNPASDVFEDVSPFDPAVISRNVAIYEIKANKREFLKVLKEIYNPIISNPVISPALKTKYQGQLDIAEALLTSSFFDFDSAKDVRDIYRKQNSGNVENYINYRTFLSVLLNSNGKKDDFLKKAKWAKFKDDSYQRFVNALKSYNDKVSAANNPFTKSTVNVNPARQQKSNAAAQDELNNFMDSLK